MAMKRKNQEVPQAPQESSITVMHSSFGLDISIDSSISNPELINARAILIGGLQSMEGDVKSIMARLDGMQSKVKTDFFKALARLPRKLDKEKYDGFTSPVSFAESLGFNHSEAYYCIEAARLKVEHESGDSEVCKEYQEMPLSNMAKAMTGDVEAFKRAMAAKEITAETPQSKIVEFAKRHPKSTTKGGKPKVVTILVDSISKAEGTEDELKALLQADGVELLKAKSYTFQPVDAPSKSLTARVYVKLWYDGETGAPMTEVHTFVPKYTPDAEVKSFAEKERETMISRFAEKHGMSLEEAAEMLSDII